MSADPVKEFTTLCDIEREGSLSQLLVAPQHRRSAGIGENEQTSNEATEEADHERDNEDPFSAGDPLPVTTPYQIQGYFNAEPPQSIQALQRETQVPSPVTLSSLSPEIGSQPLTAHRPVGGGGRPTSLTMNRIPPHQEDFVALEGRCVLDNMTMGNDLTEIVLKLVTNGGVGQVYKGLRLRDMVQNFYTNYASGPPETRPDNDSIHKIIRDILKGGSDELDLKSTRIVEKVDGLYCRAGWHLREDDSAYCGDMFVSSSQVNLACTHPSQKNYLNDSSMSGTSRQTKRRKGDSRASIPFSPERLSNENQGSQSNSSTSPKFKCYDCGKDKFDNFEKLERHDYTHHPHEVFICPFINADGKRCHHMKTRKDNFRKHSLAEHKIDQSQPQNQWYKEQLEESVHQIHDRSHEVCPFCPKVLHDRKESRRHVLGHQKNGHSKELDRVFKHRCPDPLCGAKDHWKSSKDIPAPFRQREQNSKPPMPGEIDGGDSDNDGENQGGSNLGESSSGDSWRGNGTGTDQGNNGNSGSKRDSNEGSRHYRSGPSGNESGYQCQYQSEEASVLCLHRNSLRVKCGNKTCPLFISVRELGQGSFGMVDEVFCIPTMQTYARKITPFPHTSSSHVMSEQKILQRLNHQHIIKLVGFYAVGSSVWLITSPAAESDLAVYLRRIGPEGPVFRKPGKLYRHLLRKWTGCLLSALEHLHDNRIVHGDIKPKNILVFSNQVYLADFGTAKDYGSANYSEGMPRTGARKASGVTPKYCAPEVSVSMAFSHVWSQAAAADIFSLGCVFAEMATVYAGQSIQAFENFRLSGNGEIAFHANIRRTCWWMDTLPLTEEPDSCVPPYKFLQTVKDMLSFDPLQRPTAKELTSRLRCTCGDMSSKCQDYGLPSWLWSGWRDPKRHDNSSQHGLCHDSSSTLKYGIRASSYFNVPSPFRYDQTMPRWPIWGINCRSLRVMNSPTPKLLESYLIDDRARPCIIQKTTLAGGYLSLLFNITVGPIYLNLSPDNSQGKHEFRGSSFSLKTHISHSSSTYYGNELAAFRKLEPLSVPKLIGFDESYPQRTLHGLHSLEGYFQEVALPVTEEDIIELWNSPLCLAEALRVVRYDSALGPEGLQVLHGWHKDVKPANIVSSTPGNSPYAGKLRASDLGSHFKPPKKKNVVDARDASCHWEDKCSTLPNAPHPHKIQEGIDVRSLGSISSKAATLVALGMEGAIANDPAASIGQVCDEVIPNLDINDDLAGSVGQRMPIYPDGRAVVGAINLTDDPAGSYYFSRLRFNDDLAPIVPCQG